MLVSRLARKVQLGCAERSGGISGETRLDVRVKHIYRLMGNGSTDPMLAELEGSEVDYAVIKLRSNRQGARALVNELVSYRLAKAVCLPIPRSGVAVIDSDTTSFSDLQDEDRGNCFYSEYIDKPNVLIPAVVSNVVNKTDFEKIILFDHIVYNKDRNRGNLIIDRESGTLYAIDHTHVFKNQTIWDTTCFSQGMQANDYLDEDIMEQNRYDAFFESSNITARSLAKSAELFKTQYTEPLFRDAIDSIPDEWSVPKTELEGLVRYLKYRVDHLDDICRIIAHWRGRR